CVVVWVAGSGDFPAGTGNCYLLGRLLLFGRRSLAGRWLFPRFSGRGSSLRFFPSADQGQGIFAVEWELADGLLRLYTRSIQSDVHAAILRQDNGLHVLDDSLTLSRRERGIALNRLFDLVGIKLSLCAEGAGLDALGRNTMFSQEPLDARCKG